MMPALLRPVQEPVLEPPLAPIYAAAPRRTDSATAVSAHAHTHTRRRVVTVAIDNDTFPPCSHAFLLALACAVLTVPFGFAFPSAAFYDAQQGQLGETSEQCKSLLPLFSLCRHQ